MSVTGGLPTGDPVVGNSVGGALAFLVGSRSRLVLVVVTVGVTVGVAVGPDGAVTNTTSTQ